MALDSQRTIRIEELFEQASALPAGEREAFLREACGDDKALLDDLQSLLSSHDQAQAFMETPAVDAVDTHPSRKHLLARIGKRIGQYTINRVIGAGGMGTVFEGEQQTPKRTVAIKLMNANAFDESLRRRFEYEAQILAQLHHPGIAQIYEAGIHEENGTAIPYFAMELIPGGQSVIDYAVSRNAPIRDRLALFATICDAVHHGHQKGIIHRDLKPANILVPTDGDPKIIDFGVARATESDIALTTLKTQSGQLVGTLQYMSPEQCGGDPNDIDTRTDVYSLGVILFELLSGARPYDVSGTTIAQATKIIREHQPVRLSTINRALRGDVETITRKALEKEKQRRYASAAELASDVRRYLNNEPITAHPPSAVYQIKKLVARHKAPVALIAVIFGLLIAAGGTVTYQAGQVSRERDKVQRINQFLRSMLSAADPTISVPDLPIRTVLDRSAERVQEELGDDPVVEASVRDTIGQTYLQLGLYDEAELHLVRALELRREWLGPNDPATLNSTASVAAIRYDQGRLPEGLELSREVIRIQQQLLGPTHRDTLRSKVQLVATLWSMGKSQEAESLCREAFEQSSTALGEEDDTTLVAENTLAILLAERGDMEQSAQHLSHVVEVNQRKWGPDHPHTLTSRNNLSQLYERMGRFDEAETLLRETLEGRRRVLGERHPNTLTSMNNLGSFLREHDRLSEALPLLEECLRLRREVLGEQNPNTLTTMHNLASLFRKLDRLDESESLFEETLDLRTSVLGAEHPRTLKSLSGLAVLLRQRGELDRALELTEQAIDALTRTRGANHPQTLWERANYGSVLNEMNRFEEARTSLTATLESAREALPADHWQIARFAGELGAALLGLAEYEAAEPLLLESHQGLLAAFGEAHFRTQSAVQRIERLYESWGNTELAEAWRQRLPSEELEDSGQE